MRQATHDELTGLINRRELLMRLNDLVDEGAADSVDLLFIDLDRFKDINDSIGHAAGDEVLRVIGQRLSELLGERVHVSRIGGDEFVIFLVDAPPGEATRVAHDVIVRMREPFTLRAYGPRWARASAWRATPCRHGVPPSCCVTRTPRCITPNARAVRMCGRLARRMRSASRIASGYARIWQARAPHASLNCITSRKWICERAASRN
nr:GGDEF domain-containing protein [Caballeronia sp. INML2]